MAVNYEKKENLNKNLTNLNLPHNPRFFLLHLQIPIPYFDGLRIILPVENDSENLSPCAALWNCHFYMDKGSIFTGSKFTK